MHRGEPLTGDVVAGDVVAGAGVDAVAVGATEVDDSGGDDDCFAGVDDGQFQRSVHGPGLTDP